MLTRDASDGNDLVLERGCRWHRRRRPSRHDGIPHAGASPRRGIRAPESPAQPADPGRSERDARGPRRGCVAPLGERELHVLQRAGQRDGAVHRRDHVPGGRGASERGPRPLPPPARRSPGAPVAGPLHGAAAVAATHRRLLAAAGRRRLGFAGLDRRDLGRPLGHDRVPHLPGWTVGRLPRGRALPRDRRAAGRRQRQRLHAGDLRPGLAVPRSSLDRGADRDRGVGQALLRSRWRPG